MADKQRGKKKWQSYICTSYNSKTQLRKIASLVNSNRRFYMCALLGLGDDYVCRIYCTATAAACVCSMGWCVHASVHIDTCMHYMPLIAWKAGFHLEIVCLHHCRWRIVARKASSCVWKMHLTQRGLSKCTRESSDEQTETGEQAISRFKQETLFRWKISREVRRNIKANCTFATATTHHQ